MLHKFTSFSALLFSYVNTKLIFVLLDCLYMVLLDDIGDYWSKRAKCFSESVNGNMNGGSAEVWRNRITDHFDMSIPKRILDIGTGPGFFPMLLSGYGHEITAVDYSDVMLEKARSNCKERGCKVEFIQMDAHALEFQDESFDLVISRNLIWNLERPKEAYREWTRVLRSNGTMMIFDANHYLHLFDEKYADSRHASENEDVVIGGVDTSIMRDIAKDLPLSKERRPQWDFNALVEIGMTNITVKFDKNDTLFIDDQGSRMCLPDSFMIYAIK